jgi:hypothetical protein
LIEALSEVFAWIEFLPINDRSEFADEFARFAAAGADLDNYAPLMQLVDEWRSAAEIHADPALARLLARPLTADGPSIPTPTA